MISIGVVREVKPKRTFSGGVGGGPNPKIAAIRLHYIIIKECKFYVEMLTSADEGGRSKCFYFFFQTALMTGPYGD